MILASKPTHVRNKELYPSLTGLKDIIIEIITVEKHGLSFNSNPDHTKMTFVVKNMDLV